MKVMKSLLVGAAACAAVVAAPAVVSLPGRDANPEPAISDPTVNLKTMTLHGDRVAYRDEGTGESCCWCTVWVAVRIPEAA